mmetsp:Transcript_20425/g.47270  ORF Transcript_20425/g.47270 Transcript_20425/m.47270 type:complete len:104 (+) Transcript_20425:3-314(+)
MKQDYMRGLEQMSTKGYIATRSASKGVVTSVLHEQQRQRQAREGDSSKIARVCASKTETFVKEAMNRAKQDYEVVKHEHDVHTGEKNLHSRKRAPRWRKMGAK